MNRFVEHNLNNSIKVKLKPLGEQIYRDWFKQYEQYGIKVEPIPLRMDEDGWTEFQTWEFIGIFGSHVHLGMPELFETTVLIETRIETSFDEFMRGEHK